MKLNFRFIISIFLIGSTRIVHGEPINVLDYSYDIEVGYSGSISYQQFPTFISDSKQAHSDGVGCEKSLNQSIGGPARINCSGSINQFGVQTFADNYDGGIKSYAYATAEWIFSSDADIQAQFDVYECGSLNGIFIMSGAWSLYDITGETIIDEYAFGSPMSQRNLRSNWDEIYESPEVGDYKTTHIWDINPDHLYRLIIESKSEGCNSDAGDSISLSAKVLSVPEPSTIVTLIIGNLMLGLLAFVLKYKDPIAG
jgi:hypothetical protein